MDNIEQIDMSDKDNWDSLVYALENSISNHRFYMDNHGLLMFWTTGWMSNCVYYLAEDRVYVIAEVKEETLLLYEIIADHKVDLETVINAFGNKIRKVVLGFTPYDETGYTVEEVSTEDCTVFILGKDLEDIEKKKLIFPTLSHA